MLESSSFSIFYLFAPKALFTFSFFHSWKLSVKWSNDKLGEWEGSIRQCQFKQLSNLWLINSYAIFSVSLSTSLSLSLNECNMKTFIHKTLDKDSLSVNANHPISIDGCKCFPKWTVTTDRYNTLIRMLMGMAQLCVNPSDWAFLLIWHIFFFINVNSLLSGF